MTDTSGLIEKYEKEYSAFVKVCEKIKCEDRLRGGVCGFWSPKQVVNHFSSWAITILYIFENIHTGNHVNMEFDDDTFNSQGVADRVNLDWDSSLSEIGQTKEKIIEFIEGLSPDEFSGMDAYTQWISGISEDFQHHRSQFEKWI